MKSVPIVCIVAELAMAAHLSGCDGLGRKAPVSTTRAHRSFTPTSFVTWHGLPIACSPSQIGELRPVMRQLCELLGTNESSVVVVAKNPVCCFWIEIDNWVPNPGCPGFVMAIQGGGAVLRASNVDSALRAVESLRNSIKRIDDRINLPLGVYGEYSCDESTDTGH